MSTQNPKFGFFTRMKLLWFQLLRSTLHLWVKARILPEPFEDLELDRDQPLCFVIDSYSLTSLLILDKAWKRGCPGPCGTWSCRPEARRDPISPCAAKRD